MDSNDHLTWPPPAAKPSQMNRRLEWCGHGVYNLCGWVGQTRPLTQIIHSFHIRRTLFLIIPSSMLVLTISTRQLNSAFWPPWMSIVFGQMVSLTYTNDWTVKNLKVNWPACNGFYLQQLPPLFLLTKNSNIITSNYYKPRTLWKETNNNTEVNL